MLDARSCSIRYVLMNCAWALFADQAVSGKVQEVDEETLPIRASHCFLGRNKTNDNGQEILPEYRRLPWDSVVSVGSGQQ